MELEIGEWTVIKNIDRKGECANAKVIGICKDSFNMINSYIVETSSGLFMQIKPHKTCRCNKIGSCSLKRVYQN